MAFRGSYDFNLDAKHRLTVPAKFRAALADGVVLAKGVESCVAIWTPAAYDAWTQGALASLNPLSPDARELRRFFSANAFDAELDSAGRVMLPDPLRDHAGLGREVVVAGAGDCIEVWERSAWAAYNGELVSRVTDITASLGNPA